jgi:hypothetical protein
MNDSSRKIIALATPVALAATATVLACARAAAEPPNPTSTPPSASRATPTGHEHDWDWLVGTWRVRHHRLKARLAGSTEWEDFAGTSALWLTMGGLGTVDDNVLEIPSGTYRAVGIRAFDPKTEAWSIWWLDARNPTAIEPPVHGGFEDGVGTFTGEDTLRGKPILVRFQWSRITPTSAHWEQAFSPDAGASWEVNWTMEFSRAS